jgi:hypothetical protein
VPADLTLDAPAFRGPIHEIHHMRSVFPGEVEEFFSVQILGFFA